MSFFFTLLLFVFTSVLGELLRPKVQQQAPKPASLSDFQVPTATEDRPIPVIWGTVEISGPNVIWYGDLLVQPIQKSVSTGFFSSETVTTGYRYFIGQQFALCRGPIDGVLALKFDNYATWEGNVSNGTFLVDQAGLFGGEEREGGFKCRIDVLPGNRTQVANAYVAGRVTNSPGYRGIATVVFEGPSSGESISGSPSGYLGTQSVIKQPKFTVRRLPSSLGSEQTNINDGDANPAEIVYEILTNAEWGMGLASALVDTESFTYAANQLYSESFGLSLIWDSTRTIEDMAGDVLKHIDGVLYTDYSTGKFTLKLARGDYDTDTIPVFDDSTIASLDNYSVSAWDETTNEVRVSYLERRYFEVLGKLNNPPSAPAIGDQYLVGSAPTGDWATHAGELARWGGASWGFAPAGGYQDGSPVAQYVFTSRVATAQDLGNYQIQKQLISGSVSYPGITNADLAQRVCQRDLRTLTYPLVRANIKFNRAAYNLRPGAVFKLNWPELNITGLVMRVLKINYGGLENGQIGCEVIEDIFALGDLTYAPPTATSAGTPANEDLGTPVTPTDAIASIAQSVQDSQIAGLPALANGTDAPPSSPAQGDKYIVGTAPTGAWAGHPNQIAVWDGTAWRFQIPTLGQEQYLSGTGVYVGWNGTAWVPRASGGGSVLYNEILSRITIDRGGNIVVGSDGNVTVRRS